LNYEPWVLLLFEAIHPFKNDPAMFRKLLINIKKTFSTRVKYRC